MLKRLVVGVLFVAACERSPEFVRTPTPRSVSVSTDNRPPQIRSIVARADGRLVRMVRPGSRVTVRATVTDPDGDSVRYRWAVDAGAGTISSIHDDSTVWSAARSGSLLLIAHDPRGAEARARVRIARDTLVAVSGNVVSSSGDPIDSAEVEVSGRRVRTNRAGAFSVAVPSSGGSVVTTIRKKGYATVSRVTNGDMIGARWTMRAGTVTSVNPTQAFVAQDANSTQNCQGSAQSRFDWARFPRQRIAQVEDLNGNLISGAPPADVTEALELLGAGTPCGPGVSISVPANAVVDAAGNTPTGNIDVSIATADIYAPDGMPGDYTVRVGQNATAVMQSYGVGTVDLYGRSGRYQLRKGATATLTIPVDPTQVRLAQKRTFKRSPPVPIDSTIPLLVYDGTRGEWTQDGTAHLDRAKMAYVASVTHFSEFNMDVLKTAQSCVKIDARALPDAFTLEITIPMGGAAPVVRTHNVSADLDNVDPYVHALYNLPSNAWIALVPYTDDASGPVPLGTFMVNTGPPQVPTDPNRPVYDYGACQSTATLFEVSPTIDIAVDAATRRFGPLPAISYALADEAVGNANFYPLTPPNTAYSFYGLFDTGATGVRLFNQIPYNFVGGFGSDPDGGILCVAPNRLTDANWWSSDANFLGITGPIVARVRLAGISATSASDVFNSAAIEVRTVDLRPHTQPRNLTLIGAPVTQRVAALIDYRSESQTDVINFYPDLDNPAAIGVTVTDRVYGPTMTFYHANDPAIPFPELSLTLERWGTPANRWIARNATFRNGAASVSSETPDPTPYWFLYDTGTTITMIGDRIANLLALTPGTGTFSCAGGTNNGYTISEFTMTGPSGSYRVTNAPVCWDAAMNTNILSAVLGSNFFDQVPVLFDGPRDRLGIGMPTPTPVAWSLQLNHTCSS